MLLVKTPTLVSIKQKSLLYANTELAYRAAFFQSFSKEPLEGWYKRTYKEPVGLIGNGFFFYIFCFSKASKPIAIDKCQFYLESYLSIAETEQVKKLGFEIVSDGPNHIHEQIRYRRFNKVGGFENCFTYGLDFDGQSKYCPDCIYKKKCLFINNAATEN